LQLQFDLPIKLKILKPSDNLIRMTLHACVTGRLLDLNSKEIIYLFFGDFSIIIVWLVQKQLFETEMYRLEYKKRVFCKACVTNRFDNKHSIF